jgi:S-adenosylmethionine synthetase
MPKTWWRRGLAKRAQVQLAYAIGVARPVGVYVDTFATSVLPDETLAEILQEVFDARPAAIIAQLTSNALSTGRTSAYGHFGAWRNSLGNERTRVAELCRRAFAEAQ